MDGILAAIARRAAINIGIFGISTRLIGPHLREIDEYKGSWMLFQVANAT